jgi:DNA-binding NtrC family response regulator
MIRVVLLSEDVKLHSLLAPALGEEFQVITETNVDGLKNLSQHTPFDVVLVDIESANANFDTHPEWIAALNQTGAMVVVLTDDEGRPYAVDLIARGAFNYCRNPPAMRELKAIIHRAYEHATMKRELGSQGKQFAASTQPSVAPSCDALIGESQPMRDVYDVIHRVRNLNASVLITGESGTGKELIARAIHNLSHRGSQPFVAVSCGAIPETLIESELFGHEKGAFTGTTGTRTGYFEEAGEGTLFLDEIGELSPQTQVKLLRVLQQKEFSRLGSGRAIPLKARIIFATHRDLPRMVEEGKFRLDLYYRVNVVTINAPSLAERPEDIEPLANYFLRQYSELHEKPVSRISSAAMACLEDYEWPGNVRELENIIQSAIIYTDGDEILLEDLPGHIRSDADAAVSSVPVGGTFERLLREYKLKLALKAIDDCNGNKTLGARKLGISRAYLHRLIRQAEVETLTAA